jgi:hypothetical protein
VASRSKTLAERIRDCVFEGRREAHRVLLDGDLVADEELAEVQRDYQAAGVEAERRSFDWSSIRRSRLAAAGEHVRSWT